MKKLKIMFVGTDLVSWRQVQKTWTGAYEVVYCHNAITARRKARDFQPDFIIISLRIRWYDENDEAGKILDIRDLLPDPVIIVWSPGQLLRESVISLLSSKPRIRFLARAEKDPLSGLATLLVAIRKDLPAALAS
ncbi:MAG: hypothetical protein NUV82_03375 [Candidatus Komeilibacteria bacterium]|nr:hypothetical protein [Candidatus Komeilibacteria bacterium]